MPVGAAGRAGSGGMIKLTPTEIAAERLHGELTDLLFNLVLVADYLEGLESPLREALTPLPREPKRDRALFIIEVIPAWREFVRGMAEAARRQEVSREAR